MKRKTDILINPSYILSMPIPCPSLITHMLGMFTFTLLMFLGAFIRFPLPFTPVPITLQTFFMFLAAGILGTSWGTGAMGLYALLGITGLPVFASTSAGLAYIFGPTGGYLSGFIAGAWIIGRILKSRPNPSLIHLMLTFSLAMITVYIFGVSQLIFWSKCSILKGLYLGVIPFIPGDITKILIASIVVKWNRIYGIL